MASLKVEVCLKEKTDPEHKYSVTFGTINVFLDVYITLVNTIFLETFCNICKQASADVYFHFQFLVTNVPKLDKKHYET